MNKQDIEKLKKKFPEGGYSEGVDVPPATSHSWMSGSNYGGIEDDAAPDEPMNYGEAGQNMQGDISEEPVRPDDELLATVREALVRDPHVDETNITANVYYGVVTLRGTVSQRQMMNAAIECVRLVPGVTDVINDLRIKVM